MLIFYWDSTGTGKVLVVFVTYRHYGVKKHKKQRRMAVPGLKLQQNSLLLFDRKTLNYLFLSEVEA